MSLVKLDPPGSKIGPGRVQNVAELKAFFQREYPRKMLEQVADDTGINVNTIRKWFFREPQREPSFESRLILVDVYGAKLAAEAHLPFAVWREMFLLSKALGRAA